MIFDVPFQLNGVVKLNVLIPETGTNVCAYTCVDVSSIVLVKAAREVGSILIAKPFRVEPTLVTSIAIEVILPATKLSAVNSDALIRNCVFAPPYTP